MRALRAELRKLLTVRSTYVVHIIVLGLTAAVSFWASGYKADGVLGSYHWQNAMLATITGVSFFVGITPILLITHEYRHNLIYYTLTGIRSRSSVFWAKVAVSALYSLVHVERMALHLAQEAQFVALVEEHPAHNLGQYALRHARYARVI